MKPGIRPKNPSESDPLADAPVQQVAVSGGEIGGALNFAKQNPWIVAGLVILGFYIWSRWTTPVFDKVKGLALELISLIVKSPHNERAIRDKNREFRQEFKRVRDELERLATPSVPPDPAQAPAIETMAIVSAAISAYELWLRAANAAELASHITSTVTGAAQDIAATVTGAAQDVADAVNSAVNAGVDAVNDIFHQQAEIVSVQVESSWDHEWRAIGHDYSGDPDIVTLSGYARKAFIKKAKRRAWRRENNSTGTYSGAFTLDHIVAKNGTTLVKMDRPEAGQHVPADAQGAIVSSDVRYWYERLLSAPTDANIAAFESYLASSSGGRALHYWLHQQSGMILDDLALLISTFPAIETHAGATVPTHEGSVETHAGAGTPGGV